MSRLSKGATVEARSLTRENICRRMDALAMFAARHQREPYP